MVDPITAFGAATAAFSAIKKGFEIGRDVESMYGDIGRWMTSCETVNKEAAKAKKSGMSVEEEALNAFMAKKKAEDMREELRQIISFTRGPSAWDELIRTEADIRKKRQQAIYAQQEYRQKVIEWIMIGVASLIVMGMVTGFIYLVLYDRGLV